MRASGAPEGMLSKVIGVYEQALVRANGDLASVQQLSLPPRHYELAEDEPLVFVTESERLPNAVSKEFQFHRAILRAHDSGDTRSLEILEGIFLEHTESLASGPQ